MKDIIKETQDKTYLNWSVGKTSPGTPGTFLKAEEGKGDKKVYYKLSQYDPVKGIVGHECVNEIIAGRLLDILGAEHLEYQLQRAKIIINEKEYDTWICASRNFRRNDETKITLESLYDKEHQFQEERLAFSERIGIGDYIYNMLIIDYLILNRDRHGANIELLKNNKTSEIRPAPYFDHGLSLLWACENNEDIQKYDVLEDKPVNNYIGSRSTYDNLALIPTDKLPDIKPLTQENKEYLTKDLEGILSSLLLNKIIEMINQRIKEYGIFYNQRQSRNPEQNSRLSDL